MTLREYVNGPTFNIKERKELVKSDPIQMIMDSNDLPYDDIRMYEGKLQKVVYVDDGRVVSIVDLLSYVKVEDISDKDTPMKELYVAYMDNVKVDDPTFKQIKELLQRTAK